MKGSKQDLSDNFTKSFLQPNDQTTWISLFSLEVSSLPKRFMEIDDKNYCK
jgi:hypothetical protein